MPQGWTAFNTAVTKGVLNGVVTYAMAVEVRAPGVGTGFQLVFATASKIDGPWKLDAEVSSEKKLTGLVYGPGSCPSLRYDSASG